MTSNEFEPGPDLNERLKALENVVTEIRSLVGPFGTAFPDGNMLVQTIHGLKYFIDPSDEIMAPQLVVYRQWEPDLSAYLINSVNAGTVFVDVGANFGYFSCLAASKIGKSGSGKVIAIEPNPAMQALLQKNMRINWSLAPVEIYDCAITDKNGFVEFFVPNGRAANASLIAPAAAAPEGRLIVSAKTLDEVLGGNRVDIMKVDVEGFETLVLRGAKNTLNASPGIQIVLEWSLSQMTSAGFQVDDLLTVFAENRLTPHHLPVTRYLDNAQWANSRIDAEVLRKTEYQNILLHRIP